MTEQRSGHSRRRFLTAAGGAVAMGCWPRTAAAAGWDDAREILSRIQAPAFPKRDFDIRKYGAAADGKTDCGGSIARTIAACTGSGGGRVTVPDGVWLTGAIHLKSNVNLYIAAGATVKFLPDPKLYLPIVRTRWEGTEVVNYSPMIYSDGQENLGITGEGTLDGGADCAHWWPWSGAAACKPQPGYPNARSARNTLMEMAAKDVPLEQRTFGDSFYLRPPFVQPARSKNILIEGVTLTNSPMWVVTPLYCSNVTVRGVKVVGHGPNTDGCDPDSCTDVLIEGCSFDTGDDCIAIKSGRNRDGRRVGRPTENVIIRDCRMKDGHGGVTLGSEVSGGIRNVFVENCRLDSPNLNQALRFKTNAMRGGTIENIFFRDITIGEVSGAVLQIDCLYEEGANGPEQPVVRNISLRGVTCKKSHYALQLRGLASSPIRDIHLADCDFQNAAEGNLLENVKGLQCSNVSINGKPFAGA